jgi:hypothetical protein
MARRTSVQINNALRETCVASLREGNGFHPMIVFGFRSGSELPVIIGVPPNRIAGNSHLAQKVIVGMMIATGRLKKEDVEYLTFASDAYIETGKVGEPMVQGSRAEAFAAGDPRVQEALIMVMVSREGADCYYNVYHRNDDYRMDEALHVNERGAAQYQDENGEFKDITFDVFFEPLSAMQILDAVHKLEVPVDAMVQLVASQRGIDDLELVNDDIEAYLTRQ